MARVIQVVIAEQLRGRGVEDDPIRGVIEIWSTDGRFLADLDPQFQPPGLPAARELLEGALPS